MSLNDVIDHCLQPIEHEYLLRSSCHPLHTKRAFPFSLALRIRCIFSSNETYNLGLLNQEMQRYHTITHTHTNDSPTRIPLVDLVVRYHPAICSISSIFHKHVYILSSSPLCLNIYFSLPSYERRTFAKWTSRSELELSIE